MENPVKVMSTVKAFDDEHEFTEMCNKLLKTGYNLVPNSFNVIQSGHLKGMYYICLMEKVIK